MPVVSREQALDLLTKEVENNLDADNLLEVCNELFPDDPYTEEEAHKDVTPLIEQIVSHIHRGLEIEEIVDLWNLIIPNHRNVWYNEEEAKIHYDEETESLHAE